MPTAQSGPEDCLAPPFFWSRHNSRKPPSPHIHSQKRAASCLSEVSNALFGSEDASVHADSVHRGCCLGNSLILHVTVPLLPLGQSEVQENQPNIDLEVVGTKCVLETHAANLQYKNFHHIAFSRVSSFTKRYFLKTTRKPRRAP